MKGKKRSSGGPVSGALPKAIKHAQGMGMGKKSGFGPKKVHGESASARLDKKSRGKNMTPSSPISGAEPKGLPGAGHKSENN